METLSLPFPVNNKDITVSLLPLLQTLNKRRKLVLTTLQLQLYLTILDQCSISIPPKNVRKPKVF